MPRSVALVADLASAVKSWASVDSPSIAMASLPAYLIAYDVLAFTSVLTLVITILTAACSKQVDRGKGWFGMMTCWLVYALSYGLLVGKQIGQEPSFGHCYVQTLLIYAAPPLGAVGTLCFYLDFYLGSCWDPSHRHSIRPGISYFILGLPWLVHVAIIIEIIVISAISEADPVVERVGSNLYCHLQDNTYPGLVNATLVILSMVMLIPLEIWTGIQLYRSRSIRAREDFRQYLAVYLRIAACTVVSAVAFGLSAITLADVKSNSFVQDLSFPCLSMAVSLIFAFQQDLVNAWLCHPSRCTTPSHNVSHPINHLLPPPEELGTLRNKRTSPSAVSTSSQGSFQPWRVTR